jgi:hypothetical protein
MLVIDRDTLCPSSRDMAGFVLFSRLDQSSMFLERQCFCFSSVSLGVVLHKEGGSRQNL